MYIPPFWVGFVCGAVSMLAILITFACMYNKKMAAHKSEEVKL